ncbi:CMGC/DYRK protein kinase [Nannizzia gypsea CBS 118893]|uniref:non-specific serine/threonine protein kinase n=1 Tax=Arthroderma gypseum (strain ATCC MYA-4604 / CBS 118893) TaxID=535722 RepID=E4UT24_ARTGP|nr:CMGC/DYRK protein kinase [Nannizzia gypsea CBS 118893]EFR00637.1 CMGC/DYRK protein kinase [Nannizzia gypsea CBS 118893]
MAPTQQWRWMEERYVAIKINATSHHSQDIAADNELNILQHIAKCNPDPRSREFVRLPLDSFNLTTKYGNHTCLAFEPLREPLWLYQRRWKEDVIPSEILKIMLQTILHDLDYLHSECHIIHTDLNPDNLLIKLEDSSILHRDALDEYHNPLPQKHCDDGRIIYLSRNNHGKHIRTTIRTVITDFDLTVKGDTPNSGCIQAEIYRAPEVILEAGYLYSADIWSLGVMLWDLLEKKALFDEVDPPGEDRYDDANHLAYITGLLGSPPVRLLEKGKRTSLFYDSQSRCLKQPVIGPGEDFGFENTITTVTGEEKQMFIKFVKKMTKWKPEERSTARELLDDPWLHKNYPTE